MRSGNSRALTVLVLLSLFCACKPGPAPEDTPSVAQQDTTVAQVQSAPAQVEVPDAYFIATGTEPFWSLKIAESQIVFQSLIPGKERMITPHLEPRRAQDANVKAYHIDTESGMLNIEISQRLCINQMSGDSSPYTVRLGIKFGTDASFTMLQGCGKYVTNPRLHDIWALEKIRGKAVTAKDFAEQIPYLEIYAAENRFSGYGGCNQIAGSLFSEGNLLRFVTPVTTLKACAPGNKESEFLQALQASTQYTLQDLKLILSNPSGEMLVLKKVD